MKIKNYNPAMGYRCFGKSNEYVSAVTLGGMRFPHTWDEPREEIPEDTLQCAIETVKAAMDSGINMIETAWGYRKSETAFSMALKELNIPRESFYFMNKGNPKKPEEVRPLIEKQLEIMDFSFFEFYGWHGINTRNEMDILFKNGVIEELVKLKNEGLIKNLGFSTHGTVEIICDAINTDYFDFVNLHYYYFFQRNRAAIDLAETKDMGVFIISPNDKGGRLYDAPDVLKELTRPYTPLQWNARFCLKTSAVHTLAFGMNAPQHFEEMKDIFPLELPLPEIDFEIEQKLDSRTLLDPYSGYEGYTHQNDPSGINIPDFLRYRKLWKCYDMSDFVKYRYNTHRSDDIWVPGFKAYPEKVALIDTTHVPENIDLKALMTEIHEEFYDPEKDSEEYREESMS